MKDIRMYIREYDPAMERLEALLERVRRDAYQAGFADAADQMFEIAQETTHNIDKLVDAAKAH